MFNWKLGPEITLLLLMRMFQFTTAIVVMLTQHYFSLEISNSSFRYEIKEVKVGSIKFENVVNWASYNSAESGAFHSL